MPGTVLNVFRGQLNRRPRNKIKDVAELAHEIFFDYYYKDPPSIIVTGFDKKGAHIFVLEATQESPIEQRGLVPIGYKDGFDFSSIATDVSKLSFEDAWRLSSHIILENEKKYPDKVGGLYRMLGLSTRGALIDAQMNINIAYLPISSS